ncbi:MAG: hypothetical protein EXR81_02115, partial [Gammaproteobacteria bacterium]|nr:hypothetical protein [Gammaproteobacteria bacterium]
MKSSNFTDINRFRDIIGRLKSNLPNLVSSLIDSQLGSDFTLKSFKEFPFALTQDLESGSPEIHSTRYMKYIMHQPIIAISHTDSLWLHRIGVPLISPFSMGVEAFTMSMAFGVLLPIFEEHFTKDPAQVFALLLISCLVIYPMIYKLVSALYSKRNPHQRSFPNYSAQDLMNEGFRLFT